MLGRDVVVVFLIMISIAIVAGAQTLVMVPSTWLTWYGLHEHMSFLAGHVYFSQQRQLLCTGAVLRIEVLLRSLSVLQWGIELLHQSW